MLSPASPPLPEASSPAPPARRAVAAHVVPFGLFLLLLAFAGPLRGLAGALGSRSLWLTTPEYWLYILQSFLCAGALIFYRPHYRFAPLGAAPLLAGAAAGLLALALWIAPQLFLSAAPRTEGGFDPTPLAGSPALYWTVLALRLVRLAVVVPLVEEIFWRGFLLRFLVREDFTRLPYRFTSLSFGVVALLFMLEHARADWPAALLVGALYNWLACRTQSLGACVLAHAVTNALLGGYILFTRQWGFW